MIIETIWLIKLLFSHALTDFILQPAAWVDDRKKNKLRSKKLYIHGLVTALVVWFIIGFSHWIVALVILITHTAIDAWKSYKPDKVSYFLIDQLLHFLVILGCWYFAFLNWETVKHAFEKINQSQNFWAIVSASLFLTTPAGMLIGMFTKQWRDKIKDAESLANAGKWIGITERIIVFILVLHGQYSAIGLLVTAKGIIRFSEKDRQEIKTEYLVIGTLSSIGIAIVIGIITKALLQ